MQLSVAEEEIKALCFDRSGCRDWILFGIRLLTSEEVMVGVVSSRVAISTENASPTSSKIFSPRFVSQLRF